MRGCPVFAGYDRGDGSGVRVWRLPAGVGWDTPGLRIRCERVVSVRDLFVGCDDVNVVFQEYRGVRLIDVAEGDTMKFVMRDLLGVLSVLHGRGLVHGDDEEATFVRGGRAVVVVFGFVTKGQSGSDLSDVARVMERCFDACEAVNRIVRMLRAGEAALKVLKDGWFDFAGEIDMVNDDSFSKGKDSSGVESPRSVIPNNDR